MEHSYSSDKVTSSLYSDTRATQLHMGMPLLYLFTSLIKAKELHNMGAKEANGICPHSKEFLKFGFWLKQKLKERRVLQSRFSRQEPETVDILAHAWIR